VRHDDRRVVTGQLRREDEGVTAFGVTGEGDENGSEHSLTVGPPVPTAIRERMPMDCGKAAAISRASTDGRHGLPADDAAMPLASAAHALVYRASHGRLATRVAGQLVPLLTTIGRRTGRSRTTPVQCVEDGDRLVVVACNAGRPLPPAWWLNLNDHPGCEVQIGERTLRARAFDAAGAERDRLWQLVCSINPAYERAQARSPRRFPVVILDPQESR
jgi:F420H(2)-dependent quinone reductase